MLESLIFVAGCGINRLADRNKFVKRYNPYPSQPAPLGDWLAPLTSLQVKQRWKLCYKDIWKSKEGETYGSALKQDAS
jgi:hypothetical protein